MDFNKQVKAIVEPTLINFGFEKQQDIQGILEYNHTELNITLAYDYNSSYEVDITLLFKLSGSFYGYKEIKEYFNNQKANSSAVQIVDENIMIRWLEDLNNLLRDNLSEIISNPNKVQTGLQKIRQRQIDIIEIKENEKLLNAGVEKYWRDKDYFQLVKFLNSHGGQLTGSIKKKYEYAVKMIGRRRSMRH